MQLLLEVLYNFVHTRSRNSRLQVFKHGLELYTLLSLTIKPAVPLGESSQEELAVFLHRLEEVPLALEGQRLLHLTGAAGVVLGTEPQVLAWNDNKFGSIGAEMRILVSSQHEV